MSAGEAFRTWDGLQIAADRPVGATVVVRRPGLTHAPEFLLLHRNAEGPEYDGDWAWTPPAGCRQPGEAVYPAALRELAEEAGIAGRRPWALDFNSPAGASEEPGRWAIFSLDVDRDIAIDLVDPEHDRYEWVTLEQAVSLIRPAWVATRGVAKAAGVPLVELTFRPMTDSDLADVARWQTAPHAVEWFHGDQVDEGSVRQRYAQRLTGEVPTRMWVVEADGVPVGYLQDYRVADHPEYAEKTQDPQAVAFDYLIGAPDLIGRGIGTRMVWEFCRDVLARDHPDAPRFIASPSHRNRRSLRVLEKCGFTQGLWIDEPAAPGRVPDTEVVCTLDVRHWLG